MLPLICITIPQECSSPTPRVYWNSPIMMTGWVGGCSPTMLLFVLAGGKHSTRDTLSSIGYSKTVGARSGGSRAISICSGDTI